MLPVVMSPAPVAAGDVEAHVHSMLAVSWKRTVIYERVRRSGLTVEILIRVRVVRGEDAGVFGGLTGAGFGLHPRPRREAVREHRAWTRRRVRRGQRGAGGG